jgi:tetratricopeptide (TPR) repeat protein
MSKMRGRGSNRHERTETFKFLEVTMTHSDLSAQIVDLKKLGDYEGAKTLLENAIVSDIKYCGPKHPKIAEHYQNLALIHQALGDKVTALNLQERARTILKDMTVSKPHSKQATIEWGEMDWEKEWENERQKEQEKAFNTPWKILEMNNE